MLVDGYAEFRAKRLASSSRGAVRMIEMPGMMRTIAPADFLEEKGIKSS